MAKKVYEEENIRAIAEKIREKSGRNSTYKTSEMPDGVESVYNAGQKAEYDRFWDNYQQNGNRTNYADAFFNLGWNDETYQPKYNIVIVGNGYACMSYSIITNTKVNIDISKATSVTNFFAHCIRLNTIQKLVVSEDITYNGMFSGCTALENITIEGVIGNDIDFKDCSKLTHESLMSIINALKDFTTLKNVTYHNGEYGSYSISETGFDPKGVEWTVTDAVLNGTTLICHGYNEDNNFYDVTITVTDINISADDVAKIRTIKFELVSYNPEIYEFIVDVVIKVSGEPTQQKTLTIGTANLLKLTEAEKKKATDKGWILA